jgi:hypothetical protein
MHRTGRIGAVGAEAFRQARLEQCWYQRQRYGLAEKPNSGDRAEGTTRPDHAEHNLAPRANTVNLVTAQGSGDDMQNACIVGPDVDDVADRHAQAQLGWSQRQRQSTARQTIPALDEHLRR